MRRFKPLPSPDAPAEKRPEETLNERERFILRMRTLADPPMTLDKLAEHFCLTRERIRQIEGRVRQKLGLPAPPRRERGRGIEKWLAARAKKATGGDPPG